MASGNLEENESKGMPVSVQEFELHAPGLNMVELRWSKDSRHMMELQSHGCTE